MKRLHRRFAMLLLVAAVLLQLFFAGRIALMRVVDPQSTAMERTRAWTLWRTGGPLWQQEWRNEDDIANTLKRAVVAAEDDRFMQHFGVDWHEVKKVLQHVRQRRQQRASGAPPAAGPLRGASTISQQLAKNLLLSDERSWLRKGQELVLAWTLEALLGKRRILEIYLNHVEWGTGLFGAEAAAQHYFDRPASALSASQAAQLAVMLPNPQLYQQNPRSAYLQRRAKVIARRMQATRIP